MVKRLLQITPVFVLCRGISNLSSSEDLGSKRGLHTEKCNPVK